jgi:hypothetical protein
MKRHAFVLLMSSFAFVSLLPAGAQAQVEKPFKITGEGIGPTGVPLPGQPARPHWIIGEATHLGRHYGEGKVQTDSAMPPSDGAITGEFGSGAPFVFEGADGDLLVCEYGRTEFGAEQPGFFELTILGVEDGALIVEALWIAEFVPVSDACTGKFAGVTGGWIMFAESEPFVLGSNDPIFYSWEGEGSLVFQTN